MTERIFILILTSVGMSAVAQLFLKLGTGKLAIAQVKSPGLLDMAYSPFIWLGLSMYGLGTILWLFVLSKVPLSLAYPFVSLGFILTAILGALVLHENVSPLRIAGIALIVGGCTLVARSA